MAANTPSNFSNTTTFPLITSTLAHPPLRTNVKDVTVRNHADFPASKWNNHFTGISSNPLSSDHQWDQIELLRHEVVGKFKVLADKPLELLKLIDEVEQLGLGYLLQMEIETGLKFLFQENLMVDAYDLFHTSQYFRVLRQRGFNVPSSIFDRFFDTDGNLDENNVGSEDVLGMVSFYEAAQLLVDEDSILKVPLFKIIRRLESMKDALSPNQKELITNSLKQPMHKDIPWFRARKFIDTYQKDEAHNPIFLRLAKYHFNFLQRCHQEELSSLEIWWKDADVGSNLPYVRDRLVESYIWALVLYYEPQYSIARKIFTISIAYLTILDDIYDAYGTVDELDLLTEAISRWDTSLFDKMPAYGTCLCKILFHFHDMIEEELAKGGKPTYCLPYLKEAMQNQAKYYHNEFLWLKKKQRQIPTMDEYRELALTSSGTTVSIIYSFAGMGFEVPQDAYDWIFSNPKMLVASKVVCRFQDDIVSHEFEQKREHIPSAVECYMNQFGVSQEEACEELSKEISDAWKDINEGCLKPTIFPFPVLERILNFTRLIHVLYRDGDSMTHPVEFLEDIITTLLVDPVAI